MMSPRREDFLRRIHRDARTAGGVLAIGHHQAQAMSVPQLGDEFRNRPPARLPYDVRDEQQFHAPKVISPYLRASRFGMSRAGTVQCGEKASAGRCFRYSTCLCCAGVRIERERKWKAEICYWMTHRALAG